MTRLREPISGVQAVVCLLIVGGVVFAQRWLGIMMNPLAWLGVAVVGEFVVQPISSWYMNSGMQRRSWCWGDGRHRW